MYSPLEHPTQYNYLLKKLKKKKFETQRERDRETERRVYKQQHLLATILRSGAETIVGGCCGCCSSSPFSNKIGFTAASSAKLLNPPTTKPLGRGLPHKHLQKQVADAATTTRPALLLLLLLLRPLILAEA
jgi:hypothetical protein